MSSEGKKRACLGAFAGAHGVKGDAKVKAFTEDPRNVAAYGPVETEDGGASFDIKVVKFLKGDFVIIRAPQIKTREAAEALKGQRLYVNRDKLPAPDEDEFYLDDLVGLDAIDETGAALGAVNAVHNFGAGDLIELKDIPDVKGARLIAFTKENTPVIDIANGRITILRAAITTEDETKPAPTLS